MLFDLTDLYGLRKFVSIWRGYKKLLCWFAIPYCLGDSVLTDQGQSVCVKHLDKEANTSPYNDFRLQKNQNPLFYCLKRRSAMVR